MKQLAVAILIKSEVEDGEILMVSRKDNLNDFGLPGGKVEEGETLEQAAIRELEEETGAIAIKLLPIFFREDDDYIVGVFYCTDWVGTLHSTEKGKIKWGLWEDLFQGSFGQYNQVLFNHLKSLKIIQDEK